MTITITKIEIESNDPHCRTTNCVVVNGKIIATSFDEGATLGMIDNIASNLSDALGIPLVSIDKTATEVDLNNDFNWEEMIQGASDYCTDHVNEFFGMPMNYEYEYILFDFNEMIRLISNAKHGELSAIIVTGEQQRSSNMTTAISQSRIKYIQADLEKYGKPLVCRKLGIHVETMVDLQLENSNSFSSHFIELLSLDTNSLHHIFGTHVDIDARKINTFDYLIKQNNFLDAFQYTIKDKSDIAIKISVRCREYEEDNSYIEGGHLGYEYFWFTGPTYEKALLIALAFVSDYQDKNNLSIAPFFRGIAPKNTASLAIPENRPNKIVSTVKNMLLSLKS